MTLSIARWLEIARKLFFLLQESTSFSLLADWCTYLTLKHVVLKWLASVFSGIYQEVTLEKTQQREFRFLHY